MYKREELEEKFSYKEVEKLVYANSNYRFAENLVTWAERKGEKINDFVEETRSEIISGIIEKGKNDEKIDNIDGYASRVIRNKIVDLIEDDKDYKKYINRKEDIESSYGIAKGAKEKLKPPVDKPFDALIDFKHKEIVLGCLNVLKEKERSIVEMYYYHEKRVVEIADVMGEKPAVIADVKFRALRKMGEALKEKWGSEIEDISGTLHDISMQPQVTEGSDKTPKPPPSVGNPHPSQNNPGINKEAKEYMDMLLHTLEVAKVMPISEMMDEYLYGRLEGEQKELFEKHLMECDKCYEKFKERRDILKSLLPVLDTIEKSKKKKLN